MSLVLLLIDIQQDYFPGGAMELAGAVEAGARAAELLRAFRQGGLPIIHVQHVSIRPGATFLVPGTPGVHHHPSVAPRAGESVIQKHHPNSFRETDLLEQLRGLKATRLVAAGMMTHMCVDSTVRAAVDLGFPCTLARNACATRALTLGEMTVSAADVQAAFLAALKGPFADVLTVAELCAKL